LMPAASVRVAPGASKDVKTPPLSTNPCATPAVIAPAATQPAPPASAQIAAHWSEMEETEFSIAFHKSPGLHV